MLKRLWNLKSFISHVKFIKPVVLRSLKYLRQYDDFVEHTLYSVMEYSWAPTYEFSGTN